MQSLLQVTDAECRYGDKLILESVSFDLQPGEIACLLGPSGCGKTTLLHAIAGFQPLARGAIALGGETLTGNGQIVPPEQRHIGVVFQDYALFPHLTVQQNIAFGLRALPHEERASRVQELLSLVQLSRHADQYPHQLSGGQQQRVALARALAPKPRLLLMDEPFSNLDTELRRSLASEVRHILREEGIAALIVTHDRSEAFVAGDKLGVLADGHLQQWDTPHNLYRAPANGAVARIVSDGNLLRGKWIGDGWVETALGRVAVRDQGSEVGSPVEVFARSEDLVPGEHDDAVTVQVVSKSFLGNSALYCFRLPNGRTIEATLSSEYRFEPGSEIPMRLDSPLAFPR
ncbi:ABC transporter ATP-binding protein [Microbulbifer flavimaris]|uniref:ABC transporter ATP-binding protein n=1 Tax=Microbulbifer flavimaris TaxID=1781068 RepID=A0ABX4HWL4_9GAMM|nr:MULTISPECIES: ABC transporter ATP-binding protein [Microbulbifer]KUJ81592.1 ABC transporter ATP-binding protein [Microbulbifer sp. ZGT114]PCO04500.1 ABC transporter ATP-binding protein [Microbulbifer flavimaris]